MNETIKKRIEQIRRGEVPEGYEWNQGRLLPANWSTCLLGQRFQRIVRRNQDNCKNVLTISAQLGLVSQREYFNQEVASADRRGYFLLKKGEFAYNKSYSEGYPLGAIKRLETSDEGIVSPLYICFATRTLTVSDFYTQYFEFGGYDHEIYRIAQEGARNHGLLNISTEDFFKGSIIDPPHPEQHKIAEILMCCDQVISLKEQLIEEKRRQKKWLMQTLLNPDSGVRVPGFERSEWFECSLSELFTFGVSIAASRAQLNNKGALYLHYGDIHTTETFFVDADSDSQIIPRLACAKISDKTLMHNGDVAFIDASEDYEGVSKFVVVKNETNVPFIAGLHTIPAHSKGAELCIEFKRYCFQAQRFKRQMRFYAQGMKVYGVCKGDLGKVRVAFPEKREQKAIACVLSTIDSEIDLLNQELFQWQQKKKALMQLLLTGIVRVNV